MLRDYYPAFRTYVKHLDLPWRKTQRENLVRLAAAFCACGSLPVRRMARALTGPFAALRYADRRFRRFLGNERLDEAAMDAALACHLLFLLSRLPRTRFVPVTGDWILLPSGRAALWLQIPYRGRALPLFPFVVEGAAPKGGDESRQTRVEKAALERLRKCWPEGFPPPVLLMDRGFDKGPLLRWLLEHDWLFIVRARNNYFYTAQGEMLNGRLSIDPGRVRYFPNIRYTQKSRLALHLVLTCERDRMSGQPSVWRLLTNVPEQELARVPKLYALRMSQEQVHRDSKTGYAVSGFALSHLGRLRKDRLERLMFLLSLIYSFLVLLAETQREAREWLIRRHWGVSLAHFALEVMRHIGSLVRTAAKEACDSVRLEPRWT